MCRRLSEARESSPVLWLSAAISHIVIMFLFFFFSFWDGLHVQHEVEVKGGVAVSVITVLLCLLVMRRSAMRLIFPGERRIKAQKRL